MVRAQTARSGLGLARSQSLKARAERVIPSCTQTFSKGPTQFVQGACPVFLVRGQGSHVWDVDGNEYIDYPMALGPVILGHDEPAVTEAVIRQLRDGVTFSLPHPLEVEAAELLTEIIPCAEMVRFGKNGSDATSGAVRVARAYTGRDVIAACYDDQTEILTIQGFKSIKDVQQGETIATLNPVSGAWEYQQVLETFAYPYDGDLFLFEGKRLSLCVTPEHRVYRGFRQQDETFQFRLVEARTLETRRSPIWMTCASTWHCESPTTFTLPRAQMKGWKTKGVVEFPIVSFLRFLGWYLAEGSVTIRGSGIPGHYSHYRISLAQFNGRNGLAECMKGTIRTLGFTPRRESHHIVFDSKELALYLKNFGHAGEKRVPEWVKQLSPDLLSVFLDALVDGDGTRSGGRVRFYSSSKGLADDVQELVLKIGRAAYVAERRNTGFARGKPIYHVTTRARTTFECKAVRRVAYRGTVYCVRVPNGIILVRRKGRCVWSGNSGYHGWQDWYIGTTTRNKGVPKTVQALTRTFEYNDLESLTRIFRECPGQVAAVILEPVGVVEPRPGFLEGVQAMAREEGAVLIFDEVITGFRLALGGAQQHFGVIPDLACFGKGMANGFPLSAVVGRRDLMRQFDEVFFSFTFGGETMSLAAALATITFMKSHQVIAHLWQQGAALRDGYNALADEYGARSSTECRGFAPRTIVTFRDEHGDESLLLKSLFQQECIKRGVLFCGAHNLCYRHTPEDIRQTLDVYRGAMGVLAEAIASGDAEKRLAGPPVQPVFRRA